MLSPISHSLVPPPRGAGRTPVCLLTFVVKSRDRHCCVWRYRTIKNGIRREMYSSSRSGVTIKKVTMALVVSESRHTFRRRARTSRRSGQCRTGDTCWMRYSEYVYWRECQRPSVRPAAWFIGRTNQWIPIKFYVRLCKTLSGFFKLKKIKNIKLHISEC